MPAAPAMTAPAVDDCWNRIGVRGDATCPELAEHVHCRNCPVYAAAALTLLDRPPPAGYLAEWTRHFAQSDLKGANTLDERRETGSALIFRAGGEWLAMPTTSIQEIAETRPVHSLPRRNDGVVLGIANIRGEILVCIALTGLLGLSEAPPPAKRGAIVAHQRLIVAGRPGRRIVMPVDEVHGVQRFEMRSLDPVPAVLAASVSPFTRGMLAWQHRSVGYLDDGRLFDAIDRRLA